MTAQCLLVDSNAYLRLARNLPKFFGGHPGYDLRCLPALEYELGGNRLRSKFIWAGREPHTALRKKWSLPVTAAQTLAIRKSGATVLEFAESALDEQIPHRRKYKADGSAMDFLSPADLTLLCHAVHFEHGLLTDELPLTIVAREYDVPVVTSLGLLRVYLDAGLVTLAEIEVIVQAWQADDDVPNNAWKTDYKKLFKKAPPGAPLTKS
jgi:hypothetical protein